MQRCQCHHLCCDHSCDRPARPRRALQKPTARRWNYLYTYSSSPPRMCYLTFLGPALPHTIHWHTWQTVSGIYKIFIYETSHPPSPTHKGTKVRSPTLNTAVLPSIIIVDVILLPDCLLPPQRPSRDHRRRHVRRSERQPHV